MSEVKNFKEKQQATNYFTGYKPYLGNESRKSCDFQQSVLQQSKET